MSDIKKTLEARGRLYGDFKTHAGITQMFKEAARFCDGWNRLSDPQKEALEMVFHKIGRILNGNPNYSDSWHDIAGYSTLVETIVDAENKDHR